MPLRSSTVTTVVLYGSIYRYLLYICKGIFVFGSNKIKSNIPALTLDLPYEILTCWIVSKITNDIFTFWIVSWIWLDPSRWNCLLEQQYMLSVLHSHHACWCSGGFRSQGISRHGIDSQSRNIASPASEEFKCSGHLPALSSSWWWSWESFFFFFF